MKEIINKNWIEFFITSIFFFIGICFFTLVSNDYGAFTYYNLPSGQFSDYSYMEFYYLGVVGISYLYSAFYSFFPSLNWSGISFLCFSFLALYLILHAIRTVVFTNNKNFLLLITVQCFIAFLFLENIYSVSHTRFSLTLCGIGLFNVFFRKRLENKEYVLYISIFLLGMLIRPESSIGMILLVSGGFLIEDFNLKQLGKRLSIPLLLFIMLFSAFSYDWKHTDVYVKKVEPEIEYKMMARRVVDIGTMKTAADSLKYTAACKGLWFDYKTLTPEYLRSIQLPTFDLNPKLKTNQQVSRPHTWHPGIDFGVPHILDVFVHTGSYYSDYIFIPIVLFITIIMSLIKSKNTKNAFKILLFNLYAFFLIYAIDYNGFMVAERHFIGIQMIVMVITLFYFFNSPQEVKYNKSIIAFAFIFLLIGIVSTLSYYKRTNNSLAQIRYDYQKVMEEIESRYQNRTIIVTNDCIAFFDRGFSLRNKNYKQNKYILYDAFTYSLTPKYLDYLKRESKCDSSDPAEMYKWMSSIKALYMAKTPRLKITEQYMLAVHHYPLHFVHESDTSNTNSTFIAFVENFEIVEVGVK